MQTLYVYDMITGGSISKANRYLVGTGTISTDGSVGSIGALKQKIITARYHLVEEFENFFFIPYDNYHNDGIDYEELLSSKNYEKRLKVVIVQNFGDAIAALKGGN